MGKYLETPVNTGKAAWLIFNLGAIELSEPPTHFSGTDPRVEVCVVINPAFDACAIVLSESDLHRYRDSSGRPTRWLSLDTAIVVKHQPALARYLIHTEN